jgi:hypothetical protein
MRNVRNFLNTFIVTGLSLFLSACALTPQEVTKVDNNQAVSVIRVNSFIDGKRTTGWSKTCFLSFRHEDSKEDIGYKFHEDSSLVVIKSKPGRIELRQLSCSEFKVLWNKNRVHLFQKGLAFRALPGRTNYAGDLTFNYATQAFHPMDLFNGGAAYDGDDWRMSIKLEDKFSSAKQEFLSLYPDASE